jgi:hypothetical protein
VKAVAQVRKRKKGVPAVKHPATGEMCRTAAPSSTSRHLENCSSTTTTRVGTTSKNSRFGTFRTHSRVGAASVKKKKKKIVLRFFLFLTTSPSHRLMSFPLSLLYTFLISYGKFVICNTTVAGTMYRTLGKNDNKDDTNKGVMFNIPLETTEVQIVGEIMKIYKTLSEVTEEGRKQFDMPEKLIPVSEDEFEVTMGTKV